MWSDLLKSEAVPPLHTRSAFPRRDFRHSLGPTPGRTLDLGAGRRDLTWEWPPRALNAEKIVELEWRYALKDFWEDVC